MPIGWNSQPQRQILFALASGLAVLTLFAVLILTRYLVLTALIGVGFGVLVSPLMNLLQSRFRVPRGISAVLFVLLILGGLGGIVYGLFVLLSDQVQLFIASAPEIANTITSQAEKIFADHPWIESQIGKLNLEEAARTAITTVFQGLQTGLAAIAWFVVVLTLSLYTAINSQSYFHGLLSLFPAYSRPQASEVLRNSANALRLWFRSQLVVMAVNGSATTLGLWILGIDYWLLLGVLSAILSFIPYIGAFITYLAAALVTLGSEPGKIEWVIALYLATQQLEGNITIPLVMRGGARLPEVQMILFMLIMGSLFGILGVFAAPPLLAVGSAIFLMTYVARMNRLKEAPPPLQRLTLYSLNKPASEKTGSER